MATKVHKTEPG
uniref:Uncharacterized protein n=1 Tax=Arundo donax TaxID=35708 RepID=A0A0A9BV26_ARUDO